MPNITCTCPACGGRLAVPEERAARSCRCPFCQGVFNPQQTVPSLASEDDNLVSRTLDVSIPEGTGSPFSKDGTNSADGSRFQLLMPGYEIHEELGRGGMGVVYRARQLALKRPVALKMILSGAHASARELDRFRAEAEAVARLQHPHIVQVYEVGEHEGRPFFSLEYVAGGNLAGKLGGTPLPPREAASLVETLARAAHAAHQQGVVHRDLKPSNVLLTLEGAPKIADFGLAKTLDGDQQGHTRTGAVMGTPSYMAPEQANGQARQVGPAADIYALGAILYETLTGRPPFKGASPMDTVFQVLHQDLVAPTRLQPKLPRDLETICVKCLDKDAARRYGTAAELADDLQAFREGRPITARPAGSLERTWKWARRRPALAALLAVLVLGAIGLFSGGWYFTELLREERNNAVAEKGKADHEREKADEQRDKADRQKVEADKQRKLAEKRETEAREQKAVADREREEKSRQLEFSRRALYAANLWRAASLVDREPISARNLLEDPEICPLALRDFTWGYLYQLCQPEKIDLATPPLELNELMLNNKVQLLATGSPKGELKLLDFPSGKQRLAFQAHSGGMTDIAVSPDGRWLATCDTSRIIKLWDTATGKLLGNLVGHTGEIHSMRFSPDGKWFASASQVLLKNVDPNGRYRQGEVRLWNVAAAKEERVLLEKLPVGIQCLAFSPDSKILAAGSTHDTRVRFLDVATGKRLSETGSWQGWIHSLSFSPNGKTLAVATADNSVHLWDMTAHKERLSLRGHNHEVGQTHFGNDNGTVISRAGTQIKVWDADDGRERFSVEGSGAIALTPDDRRLVVVTKSGANIWVLAPRKSKVTIPDQNALRLAFSPDGKVLATSIARPNRFIPGPIPTERIEFREPRTGNWCGHLDIKEGVVTGFAFSPDGKSFAISMLKVDAKGVILPKGELQIWDWEKRKPLAQIATDAGLRGVVVAPNGTIIAAGQNDAVMLWEADVWKGKGIAQPRILGRHNRFSVSALACSRDDRWLASAAGEEVKLWDLENRREKSLVKENVGKVGLLAFSPDGKTLAISGPGRPIDLYDVATAKLRPMRLAENDWLHGMAFLTDGHTLAAACRDHSLKLYDAATGHLRASLQGHSRDVIAIAASADGRFLASASGDEKDAWKHRGEVKIWEGLEQQESLRALRQPEPIRRIDATPDGRMIVTLGTKGFRTWQPDTGKFLGSVEAHADAIFDLAIDADSGVIGTGSRDQTARFWDSVIRRPRGEFFQLQRCVHSLAFAPDGNTAATGSCDAQIRLWDRRTAKVIATLKDENTISAVAYSRDGKTLVTAATPGHVKFWDIAKAKSTATWKVQRVRQLTFTADGKTLIALGADGPTIPLWNFTAGKELPALRHGGTVKAVAVSRDGGFLASFGAKSIKLWDLTTGKEKWSVSTSDTTLSALAFTADGRFLLGGGVDRTLRRWDAATGQGVAWTGD